MHATLEAAQEKEICLLLQDVEPFDAAIVAGVLMDNKDAMIDILTTTATSKPRARKANGGTKKRLAKPQAVEVSPTGAVAAS